MKTVYIFLAEGFEEIEALTVVDMLRRAKILVKMTGISGKEDVLGSHGIRVGVDASMDEVSLEDAQMLILPGGMPGTKHLGACVRLAELLREADRQSIHIGAICAAPSVLGDLQLLNGRKAVCYPGFEERLTGAKVLYEEVVTDGHITTSRGMGTAIPFALELIACLKGKEAADEIAQSILYRDTIQ